MGRNKIKIEKISNDRIRQVSYYKRRKGLLKKAMELSLLCDIEVFLSIVDKNNSLSVFSSKSSAPVFIEKYLQLPINARDTYTLDQYRSMFGDDFESQLIPENDEYSISDEQNKEKSNSQSKSTDKKTFSISLKQINTVTKQENSLEEDDGDINNEPDDGEASPKHKSKNERKKSKNKKDQSSKKSKTKTKTHKKRKTSTDSEIDEPCNLSLNEAKESEPIDNQNLIEGGTIKIQLDSSMYKALEECKNNEKAENFNKNRGSNNKLKMSTITPISDCNKIKDERDIEVENDNKKNSSIGKLKKKYMLKVNIPSTDVVTNIKQIDQNTNTNPHSIKKTSKGTYSNLPNSVTVNGVMPNNRLIPNNGEDMVNTTDDPIRNKSDQTNSLNLANSMNICKINNNINMIPNSDILSNDMTEQNYFPFKPDMCYNREILSASFNNQSYFPPHLSNNRSHLQSPFFIGPHDIQHQNAIHMNSHTRNAPISTYNDFLKTMTPPPNKQLDSKGCNMLGNYFQYPYGNDVNDNLNHKRYREDGYNNYTPLSHGRFAQSQYYPDQSGGYFFKKNFPSLTPTPNPHMGFDYFEENLRNGTAIENNLINQQQNRTLTGGFQNRNLERNELGYLISPNTGNLFNWPLSAQNPNELNR